MAGRTRQDECANALQPPPHFCLCSAARVAKVGDAGLARWAALRNGAAASVVQGRSSAVVGTWGYTDPQYMQFGSYGPGSDVYSLGAVMLQLLTARPMLDPGAADGQSGWRCAALHSSGMQPCWSVGTYLGMYGLQKAGCGTCC